MRVRNNVPVRRGEPKQEENQERERKQKPKKHARVHRRTHGREYASKAGEIKTGPSIDSYSCAFAVIPFSARWGC